MTNKYKQLKKENKNKIYLFKQGIFFIALNEDAKYLNKELDLKITNYNKDNIKVGFPVKSINKYTKFIKLLNKDYELIYNAKDYIINNLNNININKLTHEEALNLIIKYKEKLNNEKS